MVIINLFRCFGPILWPLVFSKFRKAGLAEGVVETLGNASAGLAPGKAGAGRELPDGAGLKTSHKTIDYILKFSFFSEISKKFSKKFRKFLKNFLQIFANARGFFLEFLSSPSLF